MAYGERLRELDLFSLQGRLLRADLILVWKKFNDKCAISVNDLSTLPSSSVTRGHSSKITVPKSRLYLRHKFFAARIVNDWNSLSTETVEAGSLNILKKVLLESHQKRLINDSGDKLYKYRE